MKSKLAITSLILIIILWLLVFFSFLFRNTELFFHDLIGFYLLFGVPSLSILVIIFSSVSLYSIKKNKLKDKWMSIVSLIISVITFVLYILLIVIIIIVFLTTQQ